MDNNEEKKVRIKLERHIWPDEAEVKESKRQKKLIIAFIVVSMALVFFAGWALGTTRPIQLAQTNEQQQATKIDAMMDLLSNGWYFGKDDPNIKNTLMDRALYGMATSEVDPHTTYFSEEELGSFTQSINMNYVGIGVQYTATEGAFVISKVFKNSPAEKVGVLPGDIISKVDGVSVENKTSDDVKTMVTGESGSKVSIEFIREGKPIVLELTRAEVHGTVYGKMLQDDIGYLEIYQFGESTGYEVEDYLNSMVEQGMTKLVIDLRNNGGGYLDAFVSVVSKFVDKDTVVMKQEYADGSIQETKAQKGKLEGINGIVVLINESSASASEVLTLALSELRDDVTTLGTKSYGKGTVQVTQPFTDGSALKYTTSKWLSPSGKSIDGEGIIPDVEVKLDDILYEAYLPMEDNETYTLDQVSNYVKIMQEGLEYLEYNVDRKDGYFDDSAFKSLKQFETDKNLIVDGILDKGTFEVVISSVIREYSLNESKDVQLNAAIDLLKQPKE